MARSAKTKKRPTLSALRAEAPPTPQQPKRPIKTHEHSAFSGWPMIIAWVGMLIFALHASTHMVAAGDTWVAMACGRHFVNHGVDTVEPFSANSHKPGPTPEEIETWPKWAQSIANKFDIETVKRWHPTGWVNQNWLTHVIFYWLSTTLGSEEDPHFNALVYWKFAIYILTVICVYCTGRVLGANPALSAVFACFAMFVGRSFLDVRPAGFSNLLVAVFLFILVLASYRNILYIWLIVPLSVFWCNVHGGYIYTFIMLAPFVALHLLTSISKKRFVSIGRKGIYHTIAAGSVAFLAVIIFNPFHLTNLTHTFVISASAHAERWRDIHEWHPAFEWDNPVGTAVPFLIVFIMGLFLLPFWAVSLILTSHSMPRRRKRKEIELDEYQWPKIDLPLMVIAALTVYMAIRSRRFIPVAAIAACPILAVFINQIVSAISATQNFQRKNRLAVSPMLPNVQLSFSIAGAVAVILFGAWWGLKFKRIYLDAWPSDTKLKSIFMRMTASDAKPFNACRFIKMNKLQGKMFNYWTEGGCIAWGQEPDPDTGRTPLQLFMDGRAQAAYNRSAFDLWTTIISGGRITAEKLAIARARGRSMTADDYEEIGKWIHGQLKDREVWVVLMPAAVFNDPRKNSYYFVKALEHDPNWRLVFLNNKQKLFVDVATPQGKELFENMGGKTVYPDDFSKSLTLAHKMLLSAAHWEEQRRQIEKGENAATVKLNRETATIRTKEKAVAQLKKKLAGLSEQLDGLTQRLQGTQQQGGPELEELLKQKQQIEKAIETTETELENENTAIKASEKAVAELREQLAEQSEQLKTVQKYLMVVSRQGLDFATKAFKLNPSPAPMLEIVLVAGRIAQLRPHVTNFCKNLFDDFEKNQGQYSRQDGYRLRLGAVRIACIHLQRIAQATKNTELATLYSDKITEYDRKREALAREKRW